MFYLKLIDRPRKFGPGPRMASCCPLISISSEMGSHTRVMDYEKNLYSSRSGASRRIRILEVI